MKKLIDIEAEKAKVKSVIDQFQQIWETKDMELLSKIIAHDAEMVNFGTDAFEHFVGWEALKKAVEKMLPSFENIKIAVRNQVVKVHPSRNVAWFSQVWDWGLMVEGKPVHSEGQRFTGVLEKRNGKWVFVQFHNSVPVSG
ncbi:nuclear transport factor 2 family protein [Candidatus Gottesmanbacteria bacterium]|nr:nuclear transport factor 2 family protein [Candidatus Gottesmanbacteria bacterium]